MSKIASNPTADFNYNNPIWSILSQFKVLWEIRRKLFFDYRFILMGNVLLSVLFIFSCSYFLIEFLGRTSVGIFCEVIVIVEFVFRFWLICHTADRIHSSVSIIMQDLFNMYIYYLPFHHCIKTLDCIPVLRQLREKMTSQTERNKVTFIKIVLN